MVYFAQEKAPRSGRGAFQGFAGYSLKQLQAKGEGQVLNRSELFAGPPGAEADRRFNLEPEWVAVALPGLVHTGEISLALPGRKLDAGNVEEAARLSVDDLESGEYGGERARNHPQAASRQPESRR